ncbi:nitrate reductase cytochrome c-type subunit [Azohydromonas lata]|uniref:Periplasmic nitrate reductase, electron transfer subunit n=1 Tax=Azohydromonas lata TaxID=45677 RepID=A0ABU5IPX6_9BURK|nr:nitrate reductase cytochrome c-type subunit [Azohydromonas lata]MDZ5460948.1 nitrate reductase cytochrome c-type subunit [Azohydromonas lata]
MKLRKGAGVALGLAAAALAGVALAVDMTDRMRGAPITETTPPPPLVNSDNSDIRRARNYAMQPPVIPHKIDNYQLDKNANRCMFCHARTQTQTSGAPMVSITHFQDRQGNHLAELSPRRYFCTQCHVPQADLKPLVDNRFVDVNELLRAEQQRKSGGSGTGGGGTGAPRH